MKSAFFSVWILKHAACNDSHNAAVNFSCGSNTSGNEILLQNKIFKNASSIAINVKNEK
jgi:hypothetical protein